MTQFTVKELRYDSSAVDIEGEVSEVSKPRDIELRTGGNARVAEATFSDPTGTIRLVLWNEQIDLASKAKRVKITNGYVNTFRGQRQLNIGRYGKLEVVLA